MSARVYIGNDLIGLSLGLADTGMPEVLDFGPYAPSAMVEASADRSSRINGMDVAPPSCLLLPTGGMGFFGWPAIAGHRDGTDFIVSIAGWAVEGGGASATLLGSDPVAGIALEISISAFPQGVIAMRLRLTNTGDRTLTLDRCMAASMPIPEGEASLSSLSGMWGREFHIGTERLGSGIRLQENRRGRTSHDRSPGLFVTADDTTYGIHLGWSGNHCLAIDTLDDGRRLVHAGELFEPGEMRLASGESYASPTCYMTAAIGGVAQASKRLRDFVSGSLLPWPAASDGKRGMRPRPVMLNTWEGNYFDHKMESLKAQADAAAAIGIERFVLDDGWFGRRDDDTTSLGDWTIDRRKYPDGLAPLIDHVRGLGMEFGLWIEPEMVNEQSGLYRAHPDWVLQVAGRPLLSSRNQLVLDLSRPEVSEYLFSAIDAVLSAYDIAYVKWDMNRDLTHVGDRQGRAATARQTRAVYALMDRFRSAHPTIEIESCASGGGRADYGVLARTNRIWTSDCTDALERLEIQRGASLFFPPEILGAHVSAAPNHQTGRSHSLSFRALVALAYHLGVELNPLTLSPAELKELAGWIALHKELRPLLHAPGAFFSTAPVDGRYVWGATEAKRMVVFVAQGPVMMTEQPPPLRIAAENATAPLWRIKAMHPAPPEFIRQSESQRQLLAGETVFSLDTLQRHGLALPMLRPESGLVLELHPAEKD
jgi:alpha-galactosidase